jgi:ATP-binding cassette subfamily G (WHITE) protein 2
VQLTESEPATYRLSTFGQFKILSRRAALNVWRNPMTSVMQVVVMTMFAAVVGAIYYNVGAGAEGIQNRAGSFFFLV